MKYFQKFRLILVALAIICCGELSAQSRGISITAHNIVLSEVLKSISSQSDYKFVYNNNVVDVSKRITAQVSDADIESVLKAVLQGTDITYTIIDKQIALSIEAKSVEDRADTLEVGSRSVHGRVFDGNGEALPGATISINGAAIGAITDIDGTYAIIVPDDPATTLHFNYMGMKPQIKAIGDSEECNVMLEMDEKHLAQVVVTGYQTISRERSAGSFSKVEGADIQDRGNAHGDILKALEGAVPGLSVNTTAEGTSYLIRGVTSINSSQEPLYIVDGVKMSRSQVSRMVNPNDVENVTFLKDATAASIWGAQAANGVIVLTTKSGSSRGDLHIEYNGSFTFKGMPDYGYMDMMSSADFIKVAQEVFDPDTYNWKDINNTTFGSSASFPVIYPHEDAMYRFYNGEISAAECNSILDKLSRSNGREQYEKYFMSNSYLTNHSLSFSGGSDNNNYYLSLEYQREQGSSQNIADEYKVYMRDILDVTKWLKLDLSLNAFYAKQTSHLSSSDEYGGNHLTSLPYATFFDENGNELSHTGYLMNGDLQREVESVTGFSLDYMPVSDWRKSMDKRNTYSVRANAGLTIDIFDGLSYEGRFQYMIDNSKSEQFYPGETYKIRLDRAFATDKNGVQYLPSSGGYFTMGNSYGTAYTVRNQLSFDKDIEKNHTHHVTALAGFELNSNKNSSNASFLRGYDMQTMQHISYDDYNLSQTGVRDPLLPMIAAATTNQFEPNDYEQGETEYRFVSLYANGAYTLNDKYSVNASIRVDQSNLFGSDPSVQFKPIWSVGAIWNMAREKFMVSKEKIDRLNLRLSYGFAGNSPRPGEGGPYDILTSLSDPRYNEFGLGYVVTTPANDKLTWEKTRTWNLGVDFSLFGNRFGGSLDLYDKHTTNLLAQTPVDPTTGFTTVLSNVGTLNNRGIELSLNSLNIATDSFTWNTLFNITYNHNKLVSMYVSPPDTPSSMVGYEYWEDYPYGTLFGYRWAGLDPADGMPRVYDSQMNAVRSITDIDNASAVPYLGTTVPPLFGSFSNTLKYKGLELSFMFIFNAGHRLRNDINTQYTYRLTGELHNDFAKRWQRPGDELKTNIPAYFKLDNTSINESDVLSLYKYADINVLNASYIKLRDIALTYHFPKSITSAIRAENMSVRVQASNLCLIALNGEGIDPEAFYLSGGSRGERYNPYFTFGLNIGF